MGFLWGDSIVDAGYFIREGRHCSSRTVASTIRGRELLLCSSGWTSEAELCHLSILIANLEQLIQPASLSLLHDLPHSIQIYCIYFLKVRLENCHDFWKYCVQIVDICEDSNTSFSHPIVMEPFLEFIEVCFT